MKSIFLKISLIILTILFIGACAGGGSAGTGTGSTLSLTIEGQVLDENSAPVPDALVVVKETGDSDVSDQQGNFSIQTDSVAGDLTLEITSNGKTNFTTITVNEGDSTLQITVKVNPLIDEVPADQLEVNAKIVGACDPYFENFRTIRQSNPVHGQIECLAKVNIMSNGEPFAHIPIAIQFRACKKNSPWATIALGATMTGANLGIGQVPFDFRDDEKHCVYQILAPFGIDSQVPVVYEIHTLTYQAFIKK
jgi:hypothetical protein